MRLVSVIIHLRGSLLSQSKPIKRIGWREATAAIQLVLQTWDYAFSKLVLRGQVIEGNPGLNWLYHLVGFDLAKLGLASLVVGLFLCLYAKHRHVPKLCWATNFLMALIFAYHIWGMQYLLSREYRWSLAP